MGIYNDGESVESTVIVVVDFLAYCWCLLLLEHSKF